MAYMRLGDLLVSSGIITGEQLEQALALPREDGQRLGDVLIRQGVISEAQLIDALRVQLGVDFVDLTAVSIPVELAKYVPRNLAKKFLVVPVKLVQDRLYLAMHDPLDFVAQDEVKTASRKRIIPMIATRKAVEQAIERLYGSEGTARVIEEMKREAGAGEDIIPAQMARDTADPEASAPTIRFVNSLIERAFTERASDIHLEPQEGEMLVRMRIDGLLQRVLTVPADLQNTVISRLKIMGGMNIAEHKVPQDGHAMFSVRGHSLDLRIASMPTVYGEKIVLRLLDKSAQVLDKSVLGLEGRDLDNYNALLKNTSGVVLLVGVLALLVIAYLTFRRTERGRAALAAWSLTRAPLRRIHSMNAAAQFAHSMATLLAAGLPLPRALEVTANVVSNYTFSLAVRQVRQDVERGRPMAESMAGIECFPAMLTEMVGVGERSGALEETLDVIGGYYDNEVSVTTARLLAVLEPAITIALAVLVVLLLLAVYLPMFTLYGGI